MPLPRQEGRASVVKITERQTSSLPPHICYHHRPRIGPARLRLLQHPPSLQRHRASLVLRAGWRKAEVTPPSHVDSPARAKETSNASSAAQELPNEERSSIRDPSSGA